VLLVKVKQIKEGRFLVVRFIIIIIISSSSSSSSSGVGDGGGGGGSGSGSGSSLMLRHFGELHSPFSFPLYE
jgi:hypothetical protein